MNSKNISKFIIIGSAFLVMIIVGITISFILFRKKPEDEFKEQLELKISQEFSEDLNDVPDSDQEFVLYKLQDDGSYSEVVTDNPAKKLTDLLFLKMSYEIVLVTKDSCIVHVKAPDYRKLFCNTCNIDPETLTFFDDVSSRSTDYINSMIVSLENDEFDYIENDVKVPIENGEISITSELADAFYGNMYSFTEELFSISME